MKRVVCYCRVSTEEEKQLNALQKQIEELELFVNNNVEWQLVDTYVDEGRSGTTTKGRPSYQKLYNDLLTDKFDIVLIKDQSRLMRNTLDWYQFLDRLMKTEKQLYLYLDNCFYTPDNKFITGIKAMMAEEYSRELSKKITSAARRSQKNGTVYGNSRTLGYRKNHGKLEIVPEEAELVRQIFEWYSQGEGTNKILSKLKSMGVTSSTGTDFSMSTLRRLLQNERYKGLLISNKMSYDFETKKQKRNPVEEYIIIPNGVPAIVSEELWDRCAEIREARVKKYKLSENSRYSKEEIQSRYLGKYPLSGKLICKKCGRPMQHDSSYTQAHFKGNTGRDVTKWDCRTYHLYGKDETKHGCKNTRIYNTEIMACVKQVIYDMTSSSSKEDISQILEVLKSILEEDKHSEQITLLENQITTTKNKLNKLLDMLLDETIDKVSYNSKKEELDTKLNQLQEKLTSIMSQNIKASTKEERLKHIEDFLNTIYDSPENIPDGVVTDVVKTIIVSQNQDGVYSAEIHLNLNSEYSSPTAHTDEPIKLYETTYPFTKQFSRSRTEDWRIIVYVN